MSLIVCDGGLPKMLHDVTVARTYYMGLYTNNFTPLHASTQADFTEISTGSWSSYARIALSSWPGTPTVVSDVATSQAANVSWTLGSTLGSSITVYGYFVTDDATSTSTPVYWAELFSTGPQTIQNSGDSITIIPTLTMKSQY
jgi:hypothetical protein